MKHVDWASFDTCLMYVCGRGPNFEGQNDIAVMSNPDGPWLSSVFNPEHKGDLPSWLVLSTHLKTTARAIY